MKFNFSAAIQKIQALNHNEWIKEFKLCKDTNNYYKILIITQDDRCFEYSFTYGIDQWLEVIS